ncbi:MAG: hypothetical protein PWQ86_34 [Bacillota bacterium]|jgi:hypothetical protein|nr:hypothetical protein [Bacillota bacterium]
MPPQALRGAFLVAKEVVRAVDADPGPQLDSPYQTTQYPNHTLKEGSPCTASRPFMRALPRAATYARTTGRKPIHRSLALWAW